MPNFQRSDAMESEFELDPRLAADCVHVGDALLSRVLLMNDANYPWLILVPRIHGIKDLDELSFAANAQLQVEIREACAALREQFPGITKLNVASLGNVVSQLHIHVIGRNESDAAWPKPVWGASPAAPYSDNQRDTTVHRLRQAFGKRLI